MKSTISSVALVLALNLGVVGCYGSKHQPTGRTRANVDARANAVMAYIISEKGRLNEIEEYRLDSTTELIQVSAVYSNILFRQEYLRTHRFSHDELGNPLFLGIDFNGDHEIDLGPTSVVGQVVVWSTGLNQANENCAGDDIAIVMPPALSHHTP